MNKLTSLEKPSFYKKLSSIKKQSIWMKQMLYTSEEIKFLLYTLFYTQVTQWHTENRRSGFLYSKVFVVFSIKSKFCWIVVSFPASFPKCFLLNSLTLSVLGITGKISPHSRAWNWEQQARLGLPWNTLRHSLRHSPTILWNNYGLKSMTTLIARATIICIGNEN